MGQEPNITAACNLDCNCEAAFDPVCGVDNIMYYTACHAGCHVEVESEGKSVSDMSRNTSVMEESSMLWYFGINTYSV